MSFSDKVSPQHSPWVTGRSAWSRANVSGFVTVDDVGREEALAYLGGRGVSDADAVSIYRVAGGRIGLLSHLATSVADMGIGCEGRSAL